MKMLNTNKNLLISYFFLFNSAAFILAASSTGGEDYKLKLAKGDEYWNKYDNINALKQYEEAYSTKPDNYEVLLKLSRTCNDAGEEFYEYRDQAKSEYYVKKAVGYAELFQNKFPDSAAVYTYLAMSYGNLAMYEGGNEKIKLANKIKDNAERSIGLDPNDYLPYLILGIYNKEIAKLSWLERAFANTFLGSVPEGSFDESENMLKKALELKPGMITAYFQLSLTYEEQDREVDEINALNHVLKLPERNFRDKFSKAKAKKRLDELK